MQINITDDQALCAEVMDALHLTGKIVPTAGNNSTCGFLPVPELNAFICLENNAGQYVWHLLTECTQQEAMAYFDAINAEYRTKNPRLVFPDNGVPASAN